MGVFDTLIDGEKSVQVKCFDPHLHIYKPGDEVPTIHGQSFTIVLPNRAEAKFALVKDGKFLKLTDDKNETYPPYISKWGSLLGSIEDFADPYQMLVEDLAKQYKP